jgi:hypothetical protein
VAERKTITLAGRTIEVIEVEIARRVREEPNEYELEDGALIRISSPAMVVYRVEGSADAEGNPTYLVKTGISTVVVRSPRGQINGSSSKDQ